MPGPKHVALFTRDENRSLMLSKPGCDKGRVPLVTASISLATTAPSGTLVGAAQALEMGSSLSISAPAVRVSPFCRACHIVRPQSAMRTSIGTACEADATTL